MTLLVSGISLLIYIMVVSLCSIRINKLKRRVKDAFRSTDYITLKLLHRSDENELLKKRIAELENTAKVTVFKDEKLIDIRFKDYSEAELHRIILDQFKLNLPDNLIDYKTEIVKEITGRHSMLIICEIKIVEPF